MLAPLASFRLARPCVLLLALAIICLQPLAPLRAQNTSHTNGMPSASEKAEHRDVAAERAYDYFKFEYVVGSGSVKITDVKISITNTVWVEGWGGRFRTTGRAHLEYFDSVGRSFSRLSRDFEVITERKDDGHINVENLRVLL